MIFTPRAHFYFRQHDASYGRRLCWQRCRTADASIIFLKLSAMPPSPARYRRLASFALRITFLLVYYF